MKMTVLAAILSLVIGCKSDEEKMCNDSAAAPKNRVSACGEECDRDNAKACLTQTEVGTDACFTKKDAEVCRWMCLYANGKELFCAEYTKQTGKSADGL